MTSRPLSNARKLSNSLRLLTLVVVAAATFSTPTDLRGQFSIGVTAGANSASFTGDKPDKARYKGGTGLVASAILEYGFKPDVRISLQPGIVQNGTTITFDIPGTEESRDSVTIGLDYISLPVLARVVADAGTWYVTGGPVFSNLSTATGSIEGSEEETDIADRFESSDFGVIFGIGRFIPIGSLSTYVELRFTQGLVNIANIENNNSRVRNTGRQLLLGVLYTFGS